MSALALKLPGGVGVTPPNEVGTILSKVTAFGGNIFAVAIGTLFTIAAVIAVVYIVIGGIKLITSEGDPKAIDSARWRILWAIIGLSVVFFSYLIINILSKFFNVSLK